MTVEALALTAEPVVAERPSPTITWHAFDLSTGRRIQQVTTQKLGIISRSIGEATELSGFAVRCYDPTRETDPGGRPTAAGAIPGWQEVTLPGRSMLVAINELDRPIWAGFIYRRHSDASEWVTLDLLTLEGYFDRRYVHDHTFTNVDQGVIVEGILTSDVIASGVQFTVDADSSTRRTRTYEDDEDKTALSVLQELMAVVDGPEFTVDLDWVDEAHTQLAMIVRVRSRIGGTNVTPVQFVMPGSVVDLDYTEDFSAEHGATDVTAVSSGEGDTRPTSDHMEIEGQHESGWPEYDYRFTPSTSIISKDVLDQHAIAEIYQMWDGLNEITLTANLDQAPRVDEDFFLGNVVTAVLTCPRFPEQVDVDGRRVPGFTETMRCTGWEIDYDARRLAPRLVELPLNFI